MIDSQHEISEDEARLLLDPHKDKTVESYLNAMENFVKEQSPFFYKYDLLHKVQLFHPYVIHEVKQLFLGASGTGVGFINGMFSLTIDEKLVLRFKKLRKFFLTSYNSTLQDWKFNHQKLIQEQGVFPGFIIDHNPMPIGKDFRNLNVGYYPNQFMTKIDEIYVTCPDSNRSIKWKFSIYDASKIPTTILTPPTPILIPPLPGTSTPQKRRVRIKDNKRRKNIKDEKT